MNFHFKGDTKHLEKGIQLLSNQLNFTSSLAGLNVHIEKTNESILHVTLNQNQALIKYQHDIHFFRGLGLLLEEIQHSDHFAIDETPQFITNGIMVDCSRNGVMTVEAIKKLIRYMALMGLNVLMLYTEDTYEVEGEPYFGYLRGKYSKEELKECDQYAQIFGIEMIPCIQTLAHLQTFLRWKVTADIKESSDILLVGQEKTYQFIEKIIEAASTPFMSNRIHIGMDEAFLLGRGKYLDLNGHRPNFEIMNEHLQTVLKITSEKQLEPMIWSDMYFRASSETGGYYDPKVEFSQELIDSIPKEVQFVYWDYYHESEEHYQTFLKKHLQLNSSPVFAGGIWTWNGICPHYKKTFETTNAALSACKREGYKEVFATMWGDNGQETNVFSGLLGMQLYAEHGYSKELDTEKLKRRFSFCTGGDYNDFYNLGLPDLPHGSEEIQQEYGQPDNPSKYLLWQDILLGIFDKHVEGKNLSNYYSVLEQKFSQVLLKNNEWDLMFKLTKELCSVLSFKVGIGNMIRQAYKQSDIQELKRIEQKILPELLERVHKLKDAHFEQWMSTYKPFGWEVLDIRYGGVISRIETARKRLNSYVNKQIDRIQELEEERLFVDPKIKDSQRLGRMNLYNQIASVNPI